MAYMGVEFTENGSIGIVHSSWFTPLKNDVLWPPYKTSSSFNRALINAEEPDEATWTVSAVKRCFFKCDDIEIAQKKIKKCEYSSDVHTTTDASDLENKRPKRRIKQKKIISSSSSDDEDSTTTLARPPGFTNEGLNKFKSPSRNHNKLSLQRSSQLSNSTKTSPVYPKKTLTATDVATNSDVSFSGQDNQSHSPGSSIVVSRVGLEKIFQEVRKLREEVKEVKGLLKQSTNNVASGLPGDLPIDFPISTRANFETFEDYTKLEEKRNELASYFSTLGGNGTTGHVNRILRLVMSNNLACQYNFAGQRKEKRAFNETNLKKIIIRGIQIKYPAVTEAKIETAIKIWLKHAMQRIQRQRVRDISE